MRLRDKHDNDDYDSYNDNNDGNDDDGDDDSDDPKAVGDLCDQDLNQTSRQKQACLPPTYNKHNKQTICNRSKVNFVFSILQMILAKNTIRDGGSATLYTAYTVDTVNTVYSINYTAKTLSHNNAFIYYSARYWKRLMSCRAKSGSEWMDGVDGWMYIP